MEDYKTLLIVQGQLQWDELDFRLDRKADLREALEELEEEEERRLASFKTLKDLDFALEHHGKADYYQSLNLRIEHEDTATSSQSFASETTLDIEDMVKQRRQNSLHNLVRS